MSDKDNLECPHYQCNERGLSALMEETNREVKSGFSNLIKLQESRIRQDSSIKKLEEDVKEQKQITRDLMRSLGEKADNTALMNAMETVQRTFQSFKEDILGFKKEMQADMKFYMKIALAITTAVISIVVPLCMWIINHLAK